MDCSGYSKKKILNQIERGEVHENQLAINLQMSWYTILSFKYGEFILKHTKQQQSVRIHLFIYIFIQQLFIELYFAHSYNNVEILCLYLYVYIYLYS